ncbi:hypothetical protein RHMOL_Rhmol04G0136800 [Rhododendron molle]|uniref:Uncharacterized protein n=1 Tax=Rhododendron molle TaxID=49168 RepID=A0ACC0P286_RHOML|nr:hypothetical protein RHMOL_Rhmol04G0136800 [Rhododendron molle]
MDFSLCIDKETNKPRGYAFIEYKGYERERERSHERGREREREKSRGHSHDRPRDRDHRCKKKGNSLQP